MQEQISNLYNDFFKTIDINPQTGRFVSDQTPKFATFPYLGKYYQSAKKKILFIGQDIGMDENQGSIIGFEERRDSIEKHFGFNPHIAGTFIAALFLLKHEYTWESLWAKLSSMHTCHQATRIQHHQDDENPLSFIALTNYYKFVNIDRKKRSGGENRKYQYQDEEIKLFLDEIEILNPDIIVVQGNIPIHPELLKFKERGIIILKGAHPSYRKKGGRNPITYVETIKEL